MAFSAAMEWDVRGGVGSDSNGGGFKAGASGTDYSLQAAAQIAFTDLVIDGANNTKATSALNPFTSLHPGNVVNITGGSGFTVQRAEILSVAAGVATFDRALGTVGSTGGTGNLGGSLATVPLPVATLAVSGNTVHVKSATYTITTTITIGVATITISGYASTHGDNGTKPLITTATNSVDLFTQTSSGGFVTLDNLSLSNTAGTRLAGIQKTSSHDTTGWLAVRRCIFDGFTYAINGDNAGAHFDWKDIELTDVEIKNSTIWGIRGESGLTRIRGRGVYIHDTGTGTGNSFGIGDFLELHLSFSIIAYVSVGSTGGHCIDGSGSAIIYLTNCALKNASNDLVALSSSTSFFVPVNCVFYGAGRYAINGGTLQAVLTASAKMGRNNYFGNSATADRDNYNPCPGDGTLSGDPFTSSTDFTPNNTAGAGASLRGAGYPGAFGGATFTGATDVGAVQLSGGGGGGSFPFAA